MYSEITLPSSTRYYCDECGWQAEVVIESDRVDPHTGYLDRTYLCNQCYDRASDSLIGRLPQLRGMRKFKVK